MKIFRREALALILTAVVLTGTAVSYLSQRNADEPYSVAKHTVSAYPVGAAQETQTGAFHEDRININTASAGELEQLPGIGPVLAGRIVEDREENGAFRFPEEITRVSGIGEKTMEKVLDKITVE